MTPHFFLLGAFEAMFIEFICSFRNLATAYLRTSLMAVIAIIYLLAVWTMLLLSNPESVVSFFPAIGTSFGALAGFFRDKIWFYRLCLTIGCSFWTIYFCNYNAWAGMAIELMMISTLTYASFRDINLFKFAKLRPAPSA